MQYGACPCTPQHGAIGANPCDESTFNRADVCVFFGRCSPRFRGRVLEVNGHLLKWGSQGSAQPQLSPTPFSSGPYVLPGGRRILSPDNCSSMRASAILPPPLQESHQRRLDRALHVRLRGVGSCRQREIRGSQRSASGQYRRRRGGYSRRQGLHQFELYRRPGLLAGPEGFGWAPASRAARRKRAQQRRQRDRAILCLPQPKLALENRLRRRP